MGAREEISWAGRIGSGERAAGARVRSLGSPKRERIRANELTDGGRGNHLDHCDHPHHDHHHHYHHLYLLLFNASSY